MPDKYNVPTPAEVLQRCYAYFQAQPTIGDAPIGERCFEGDLARALAGTLETVLYAQSGAYNDIVPSVESDETGAQKTPCSSDALDRWAFVLGLPSNKGPGKYGRNGPQAAKGGGGDAIGTAGVIVAAGQQLTDQSSQVVLVLRVGFTIPVGGSIPVTVDAQTVGVAGNLPAGAQLRWQSPPLGLKQTLTLTTALVDGSDNEQDLALALRILDWLQSPPEGGTWQDWRRWTLAALDTDGRSLGFVGAHVYPLKGGDGSVTITPVVGGNGSARDPGAVKAGKLLSFLNSLHIVTDTIYVERPWFPSDQKIHIYLRMQSAPGYDYDWSFAFTLPTVLSGTTNTIVIDQSPPPPELVAAIADIANGKPPPRIQTLLPSSPIPFQARVTSFTPDMPITGQSTLTLDADLPHAPSGIDLLNPGGPAVLPVCIAVLAYINSVGPSRKSGYAAEDWEDSVTIARLAQAAIDARDDAGFRVCTTLPNTGNFIGPPVGVGISVDGNAPTTEDFLLFDNGSGPQLPECIGIEVRPF